MIIKSTRKKEIIGTNETPSIKTDNKKIADTKKAYINKNMINTSIMVHIFSISKSINLENSP